MAYVAIKGGRAAIEAAAQATEFLRTGGEGQTPLALETIEQQLRLLVSRVVSEGGLYHPRLAALAIKQFQGDTLEAGFALRAYRSTRPRLLETPPQDTGRMRLLRRISAAFKDIPGGQILGPTLDYSHRILDTEVLDGQTGGLQELEAAEQPAPPNYPALSDWQRLNGLLAARPQVEPADPAELPDVTREPIVFPAPRAHRLQSLARADTGGILTLGYAGMRGYGLTHPTVNEVRLGYVEVKLRHPITGETFSAGRVRLSQTEVVSSQADKLELGFAATLGWNEVKTIAAAMLDMEMDKPSAHPAHTEEFVLYHTEPVEASGFCIHYKLPHYVTFSSSLDSIRRVRANQTPNVEAQSFAIAVDLETSISA